AKRYGGVPLVLQTLGLDEGRDIPRSEDSVIFDFVISECDEIRDSVRADWVGFNSNEYGRATEGAVLALKSRAALYAASPLFNDVGSARWELAAEAANDVISLNRYAL